MARPKKLKKSELKSEVVSARLTVKQKEEIIILFGSIQAFIDIAIITVIKKELTE
jgi:hypothetical protein